VEREVLLARESDAAAAVLTEVRNLSQEQARFVREVLGESPAARPVQTLAEQPGQLWRASFETPQPPLRLMLPHAATEIELVRGASAASDLPLRLLAAVGLAGLAALVLALVRSRWWPAVHRWRFAAAAALGVAWWLWLAPSILGWLIVALAIAAAFRERAPAQRETGSTVVRLGTRGT
jgi:hypothetical protein